MVNSKVIDMSDVMNSGGMAARIAQAKEKADSDYPAAGSLIGTAITLLDTDSPDGSSVATLIQSAMDAIG